MITPDKESLILITLAAKIATVDGVSNIITDEPLFDSKSDIIDEITIKNVDKEIEVKFCKIEYLGWRDSETDGCDDDPTVFLKYRIRVFHGYKTTRSDGSSPAADIKKLDILMHNKFREKNRLLAINCEHQPLVPVSDIILSEETVGIYGYTRDYFLEVEVV